MFVGDALNHSKDTYRMLNLDTMKINVTRDLRWLNVKHNAWKTRKDVDSFDLEERDIDESIVPMNETQYNMRLLRSTSSEGLSRPEKTTIFNDIVETPQGPIQRKRLRNELRRLGTSYNPEASKILREEKYKQSKDNDVNRVAIEMLFGEDIAFFARESTLEDKPRKIIESGSQKNSVDESLNPIDALEKIQNDKDLNGEDRVHKVKLIVNYLKENVHEKVDDAWNHPDPKQRTM